MESFDCMGAIKALGEVSRLRILRFVLTGEHNVNEIATALGITQYNASKHLRILREAGLLQTTKVGQQRVYSLAPEFRSHLAENENVLDLGCCRFDFTKLPE